MKVIYTAPIYDDLSKSPYGDGTSWFPCPANDTDGRGYWLKSGERIAILPPEPSAPKPSPVASGVMLLPGAQSDPVVKAYVLHDRIDNRWWNIAGKPGPTWGDLENAAVFSEEEKSKFRALDSGEQWLILPKH